MTITKIIMIVDDDPDNIEFFCEALAEIDSSIVCIGLKGGEEAILHLQNNDTPYPDFIFLDINMPKMDGMECLVQIKADINLSSIPIVMYTTSEMQHDIDTTKKLGAAYYLTKPDKFNDLKKAIQYILESQPGRATL